MGNGPPVYTYTVGDATASNLIPRSQRIIYRTLQPQPRAITTHALSMQVSIIALFSFWIVARDIENGVAGPVRSAFAGRSPGL